jgi:ribosome-associated protein
MVQLAVETLAGKTILTSQGRIPAPHRRNPTSAAAGCASRIRRRQRFLNEQDSRNTMRTAVGAARRASTPAETVSNEAVAGQATPSSNPSSNPGSNLGSNPGVPAGKKSKVSAMPEASAKLLDHLTLWLDESKAEKIMTIALAGKSTMADAMLIASGNSDRHVGAIADQIQRKLKEIGIISRAEGLQTCDWVLIDTGDIIIHLFRPEVRDFYNLEKMWSGDRPVDESVQH